MPPTVEPIEEGSRDTVYRYGNGGSSIRMFKVSGVDVEIANTSFTEQFGLPKISPPDPHNVYFNQFVYRRDRVQIIDATTCLISVEYQTINFSIGRQYAATETPTRPELLPLIWTKTNNGQSQIYEQQRSNGIDTGGLIRRLVTQRVYTVPTGGDFDGTVAAIHTNVGKLYELGSFPLRKPYVLTQSPVWQDQTGQVFARYTFVSKAALPAYPIDTFAGQSVAIPAVPELAEITSTYDSENDTVSFTVTQPGEIYETGAPLPGLPL